MVRLHASNEKALLAAAGAAKTGGRVQAATANCRRQRRHTLGARITAGKNMLGKCLSALADLQPVGKR